MNKELFEFYFGNEKNELEELNKWIDNNILDKNGNCKSKLIEKKWPKRYNQIKKLTKFLDEYYDNINIKQRLWHIRNEDLTIQRCNNSKCNNIVRFFRNNYNIYCSKLCSHSNKPSGKRLSDEVMKSAVENDEGYTLLNRYYENKWHYITVRCPFGHEYTVLYNNWKKGARCAECYGSKKHDFNDIKNEFKNENYEIISDEYKGTNFWLEYICPSGRYNKVTYKMWKRGQRCDCIECIKNIDNYRHTYTPYELYKITSERGYILKEWKRVGTDKHIILYLICSENHHIKMTLGNFLKGHGCKHCAWIDTRKYENCKDLDLYKKVNTRYMCRSYKKYKDIINPYNLERDRDKYHVDHIYSISDGFLNSVPPYIISSPVNLQMLWCTDNSSKCGESWMTKEELYERYWIFIRKQ